MRGPAFLLLWLLGGLTGIHEGRLLGRIVYSGHIKCFMSSGGRTLASLMTLQKGGWVKWHSGRDTKVGLHSMCMSH